MIDALVAVIGAVVVVVGDSRGCWRCSERRSSGRGRFILVLVPVD